MNKAITILISVLVFAGVVGAVIYLFLPEEPAPTGQQPVGTVTPNTTYTVTSTSGTQTEVGQAFQQEIASYNDDNIRPQGEAVVVGEWALQEWLGDNQGGQGLLKYDASQRKWVMITAGGGMWTVEALVEQGVPQNVAEDLMAGRSR